MLLVTYCQPKTTIMHVVEKTFKIFKMVGYMSENPSIISLTLFFISDFCLLPCKTILGYIEQLVVSISDYGLTLYEYRSRIHEKWNDYRFEVRIKNRNETFEAMWGKAYEEQDAIQKAIWGDYSYK